MAYITLPSKGRGYRLYLVIDYVGMSVSTNRSTWSYHRYIDKGSGFGAASGWPSTATGLGGTKNVASYNFESTPRLELGSGTFTIDHDADGTHDDVTYSVTWTDSVGDSNPELGNGTVSVTISPPTIPRASQFSLSDMSPETGDDLVFTIDRASSSFTHKLRYRVLNKDGHDIVTGVGTSYTWSIPRSILDDFPTTSTAQYVDVSCTTYDGATQIGSPTAARITITADPGVGPSITDITHSEATTSPDVGSLVGAYVQRVTTLDLAMTGVSGDGYGSTIVSRTLTVAGQAIFAASGTTGPLGASGEDLPIVATVVDSRGRSAQKTVPIDVLAYSRPSISGMTVKRSLSDGTLEQDGTYYRVDADTGVSSLVVGGSEKNSLTWYIQSKPRGSGSWATQKTITGTPPSKSGFEVPAETVLVTEARDVRLIVRDVFGASYQSYADGALSTGGNPAFHLAANKSAGVGKFSTVGPGGLDVAGEILSGGTEVSLDGHKHSGADIDSGTLDTARLPVVPVSKGGTGGTSAAAARAALGLAADTLTVTVTAGQTKVTTVTLPAGVFTAAPRVVATPVGADPKSYAVSTGSVSTSSVNIVFYAASAGTYDVRWVAIQ